MLGVSLTLYQKVVSTAGGNFLTDGEILRRSGFDDSNIFQSKKQHFVNIEHQLKSKLA